MSSTPLIGQLLTIAALVYSTPNPRDKVIDGIGALGHWGIGALGIGHWGAITYGTLSLRDATRFLDAEGFTRTLLLNTRHTNAKKIRVKRNKKSIPRTYYATPKTRRCHHHAYRSSHR